jgi:uncharacterized UPF0160 family protein
VFLLRQTDAYRNAGNSSINLEEKLSLLISAVRRTRDPTVLSTCNIVVDVGGIYDDSKQLFDHHQRGFTEVFGHGFKTKLSSAGLVYK